MSKLKIGALFAGYGGLDMAVSQVTGAELAWVCEWDDAPSKILAHHYPDVPNYKDVSLVDWAAVEPVDILTGGFPCQDVSLAGARRGLKDGTRSGLWSEFAKAIEIIRPRLVVIENVRRLLSASAHSELEQCAWCVGEGSGESALRALGAVLGSLADLGYDARWKGVRAADAGAPHNRFRIFITAWPSDSNSNSDGFDSRGGYSRTVTKSQPYRGLGLVTWADRAAENNLDLLRTPVADETGGGAVSPAMAKAKGQTLRLTGQIIDLVEPGRLPTPNTMDHLPPRTPEKLAESKERTPGGYSNLREYVVNNLPTPVASEGIKATNRQNAEQRAKTGQVFLTNVAQTLIQGETEWGQYEKAVRRWEQVLDRPAPKPTEPTGRDGQQQLSAKFTEWMMGLDDGWITSHEIGLTRNEALKACGNGVVPQQAALALRILLDGVDW